MLILTFKTVGKYLFTLRPQNSQLNAPPPVVFFLECVYFEALLILEQNIKN